MNLPNLVSHHLAELMLCANNAMKLDHANVHRDTMVIRMLNVDQNVFRILSVHQIGLA